MQRSNLLHVVVGMGRNVTSWVSGPESPASGYPLPASEKNRTAEFPLKFDPSRCQRGLLLPLSGTCYTRGAKAVAERNAFWERRPQLIISRGTIHEWPEAVLATRLCACWPPCGPSVNKE